MPGPLAALMASSSNRDDDDNPEEAKKSAQDILELQTEEASKEFERPTRGLALSALSAGLDIGFSVLLMTVVAELLHGTPRAVSELARAAAYPLGFLFVILGRSELFTEHTTLSLLPVLARKHSPLALLRVWGTIYVFNLLGAALFAFALSRVGPALKLFSPQMLGEIVRPMLEFSAGTVVLSGLFAGWLMGLVSWLVAASKDTVGQIVIIAMVTGVLALCRFHHCVVGSVELLSACFAGQGVTLTDYARFLGLVTLGNCVGGTCFVALIKFGHISAAGNGSDNQETGKR